MDSAERKPSGNRAGRRKAKMVELGPVPVNTGPILAPDDDFLYTELVLMGGVACDYLTLTTFDEREYLSMMAYTVSQDAQRGLPAKAGKRMQYQGWLGDGWFVGEGRQDGVAHYMVQAYGARASECLRWALMFHERGGLVKCTRIDLQCTSTTGHAGDIPAVAEAIRGLKSGEFGGRGPRPTVTYFSSDKEEDTLYIGSRKSSRFWRFYNKKVSGRLRLRAELEAKGWLAQTLWEELCAHGMFHVKQQFEREMSALPSDVVTMAMDCYRPGGNIGRTPKPSVDLSGVLATQKWLMESVIPALERILPTQAGPEVRAAFLRVLLFDEG